MAHESHTPAAKIPFTEEEIAQFHADDRRAATAIVLLMTGIFTIGLLLYLGVCYSILM